MDPGPPPRPKTDRPPCPRPALNSPPARRTTGRRQSPGPSRPRRAGPGQPGRQARHPTPCRLHQPDPTPVPPPLPAPRSNRTLRHAPPARSPSSRPQLPSPHRRRSRGPGIRHPRVPAPHRPWSRPHHTRPRAPPPARRPGHRPRRRSPAQSEPSRLRVPHPGPVRACLRPRPRPRRLPPSSEHWPAPRRRHHPSRGSGKPIVSTRTGPHSPNPDNLRQPNRPRATSGSRSSRPPRGSRKAPMPGRSRWHRRQPSPGWSGGSLPSNRQRGISPHPPRPRPPEPTSPPDGLFRQAAPRRRAGPQPPRPRFPPWPG